MYVKLKYSLVWIPLAVVPSPAKAEKMFNNYNNDIILIILGRVPYNLNWKGKMNRKNACLYVYEFGGMEVLKVLGNFFYYWFITHSGRSKWYSINAINVKTAEKDKYQ